MERSRRGRVEWRGRIGERQAALRLEGRFVGGVGGTEMGGLGSMRFRDLWRSVRYVLHLSRFLTDSYAARIYEYEYDLPGAVSIRPLYGQGRPAPHYWGCR